MIQIIFLVLTFLRKILYQGRLKMAYYILQDFWQKLTEYQNGERDLLAKTL